jgi:hypothetical protein
MAHGRKSKLPYKEWKMTNQNKVYLGRWDEKTLINLLLLLLLFLMIFIVPVFPKEAHKLLFNSLITAVILVSVLAMDKNRKTLLVVASAGIVLAWIASLLRLEIMEPVSNLFNTFFFIFIVISLIVQIAKTKRATVRVIMESINGYLLLGFVFSLTATISMFFRPDAFGFSHEVSEAAANVSHFGDYLYYSFVNYTTLGYGDILPLVPFAKSLAILMSVSGQIYVAVIIAMLVGKYVGAASSE